jgi:hypothetical protein
MRHAGEGYENDRACIAGEPVLAGQDRFTSAHLMLSPKLSNPR